MTKNVLISGIMGGVVMFVMMMVFRFLLPIDGRTELRAMPNQVPIQAQLKQRITEPGTYVCPYLPGEKQSALFPDYPNEPIFTVTYRGTTHSSVPGFASPGLLSFLLAPMVAAWLLSQASERVLASYLGRVFFVAILGLFVAVAADLLRGLTEDLPLAAVAGKTTASISTWVLIGLVLAWRIKPKSATSL